MFMLSAVGLGSSLGVQDTQNMLKGIAILAIFTFFLLPRFPFLLASVHLYVYSDESDGMQDPISKYAYYLFMCK